MMSNKNHRTILNLQKPQLLFTSKIISRVMAAFSRVCYLPSSESLVESDKVRNSDKAYDLGSNCVHHAKSPRCLMFTSQHLIVSVLCKLAMDTKQRYS